jgi:chemotaxis protein CheX
MPTESSNEILASELARIVESVFATMLDIEVHECEAPWSPNGENLTAVLHLAGDWKGVVLLECSRRQACNFASRFLSIDPPESVSDDVRDVLGELVNMIGGNMKFLLAPGLRLSTPSVVDGSDYCLRVCGTVVAHRLAFQWADAPIWVTILATRPS